MGCLLESVVRSWVAECVDIDVIGGRRECVCVVCVERMNTW